MPKGIYIHLPQSEELIAKRVLARRGYKHSQATKEKISLSNMGRAKIWSKESIDKRSKSLSGEANGSWKGGISKIPGYRLFLNQRYRALRSGADGSHSILEWAKLKRKYDFTCPSCHRKEPEIVLTEDHILPLIKGGSDNISNIQPLCRSCNSRKHIKIIKYQYVS